jgi:hypothetical protein
MVEPPKSNREAILRLAAAHGARKVDLLRDGGLSPYLREQIEAEARPL